MPRTSKKSANKTPAKRKYVKKSSSWKVNEDALKQTIDKLVPEIKKELDELEFLDAIVLGMEQVLPEQKSRIINYLYSRYWMYITLSKLNQ